MIRSLSEKAIIVALSVMLLTVLLHEGRRAVGQETQAFVLASSRPKDSHINLWWTMIFTEEFKRLGLELEVRSYPLARASYVADHGLVDCETIRVYAYVDAHPNLIRIEEFTIPLRLVAYTGKSAVSGIDGWKSLKGTNYLAEYARGALVSETNLKKLLEPEQISSVTKGIQGLRKLAVGRTDIYVDDENVVLPEFNGHIKVAGIMDETPLHLYMHKRHADLVPKLAKTIKAIKEEGLIEQYWTPYSALRRSKPLLFPGRFWIIT